MTKHLSHQIHPSDSVVENVYPIGKRMEKERRHAIFSNRAKYEFNTLNFGGVVGIQLNNQALYSDTYIQMDFKSDDVSGSTLRRLCGLQAIQRIEYIIAGSMPVSLDWEDSFFALVDECESGEKRTELLRMAGSEQTTLNAGSIFRAYIPLSLPWSKIKVAEKFPFDSNLTGQTRINIYLAQASDVYSANPVTALSAGRLVIRTGEIVNPEDRIVPKPGQVLNFVYEFKQSYKSVAVTPASTSTVNQVYLTGFKAGSLTQILLRCLDVSKQTNAKHELNTMSNLKVSLNGQIMYDFNADNWKVANLFESNLPTRITVNSVDYYWVNLVFVQTPLKNTNFGLKHQSGVDFRNQQVLVEYTSSSTNAQILEAVYLYNGNLLCSNGNSEIVV